VQVERLTGLERHPIVDPARPAAITDDFLDDFDHLVRVPVIRKPGPVSVPLQLPLSGGKTVQIVFLADDDIFRVRTAG